MEMCRNCAAEHIGSHGASGRWLVRENVAKRSTEKAGRRGLFSDKANNNGAWRSTYSFLDVQSCFMRRR